MKLLTVMLFTCCVMSESWLTWRIADDGERIAYTSTETGQPPSPAWNQLIASDGVQTDRFGISVAISGDTAVIGAFFDDVGAGVFQGSVYVFTRNGATWTQQQHLVASDGAAGDQFGVRVALDGDTAVVGAYIAGNQGSAYVFTRSGTTWTQQQKLVASDGAAGDRFGRSVALDGDTAVVGANRDAVGATGDQGSAYVFTRSGTTWTEQQHLVASDGAAGDQFGVGVALDGNTAVVGAREDDVGPIVMTRTQLRRCEVSPCPDTVVPQAHQPVVPS